MSPRVQIDAIVEGMEMQSDDMHSYLHRPSGRVIVVSEEALAAAENEDEEAVSPEELADAQEVLSAADDYLQLPDRFEIDEYRMMERFALGLGAAARDETLRALSGRGAFRHFKDTVHRLGLAKAWYGFRDSRYEEIARDWCDAHGIEHGATNPDA